MNDKIKLLVSVIMLALCVAIFSVPILNIKDKNYKNIFIAQKIATSHTGIEGTIFYNKKDYKIEQLVSDKEDCYRYEVTNTKKQYKVIFDITNDGVEYYEKEYYDLKEELTIKY